MFKFKLNIKRISIWIIVTLQVFVISSYFFSRANDSDRNNELLSVSFVTSSAKERNFTQTTYHTANGRIYLQNLNTRYLFEDFASSLCYKNGTDIKSMQRSHKSWKCECFAHYHGPDCGQPEVIWRALLAYRKPMALRGPRKLQRRILYVFEVNEVTKTITDIRVNELNDTVDLFILYETKSNVIKKQLDYGFLKEYHKKILYIAIVDVTQVWHAIKETLVDLRIDDLVVYTGYNEIPNRAALQYFKLYDNWPEPISFRLRWSVFGFFWLHPNRTRIKTSACSVKYLYDILDNNLNALDSSKVNKINFIVGDLNHYGGWFCEYCNDPNKIIDELNAKQSQKLINFNQSKTQAIDVNFVEDLIEVGLNLDGKTQLLRTHRYHDTYFAPTFLIDKIWKYDFLMINIYSKMDYYE